MGDSDDPRECPCRDIAAFETSAIVAILRGEPDSAEYIHLLATAEDPLISAATLLEASIVLHAKAGQAGVEDLGDLLRSAGVRCVAVDAAQALVARTALARYGKGRSPSALTFGDCFGYALAMALDRPLLYKGDDFAQTDIRSVR